jgi:hypothetical protein
MRRIILLILILIGLTVLSPLCMIDGKRVKKEILPSLDPEHLTEEYEFKDAKVLWRVEEDDEDEEASGQGEALDRGGNE